MGEPKSSLHNWNLYEISGSFVHQLQIQSGQGRVKGVARGVMGHPCNRTGHPRNHPIWLVIAQSEAGLTDMFDV